MKNVNVARRWHTGEIATPNRTVSGVQRKMVAETQLSSTSPPSTWANQQTDLLWAPEPAATPLQRVAVWSALVAFSVCFWYLAGEIVVAVVAR